MNVARNYLLKVCKASQSVYSVLAINPAFFIIAALLVEVLKSLQDWQSVLLLNQTSMQDLNLKHACQVFP